jgi:cell division protease FtsH
MQLPETDQHSYGRSYLQTRLAILMGGRIAEEIFLDEMTTGAGNDIERATELARKMVCEFGMSELGPLTFGKKEEQIFLGREINQHRDYSEDTAIKIDQQVNLLITKAYSSAKDLITAERKALIRIAEALLEREVLDASDIKLLIDDKDLPPMNKPDDPTPPLQQVLKPERKPVTGGEPAPA